MAYHYATGAKGNDDTSSVSSNGPIYTGTSYCGRYNNDDDDDGLVYSSFILQGYVDVHTERIKNNKCPNVAPRKSSDPSVRGARSSRDGALLKERRKERKERYKVPYWATLSSSSQVIHPSNLAARVSSTSSSSTNLPTPDSSRKRSKRLSQPTHCSLADHCIRALFHAHKTSLIDSFTIRFL